MKNFITILARELDMQVARSEKAEFTIFDAHDAYTKFYIPRFLTRAGVVRVSGSLGLKGPMSNVEQDEKRIILDQCWLINILNLPWLYPLLYFDRTEALEGARRLAPPLKEAMGLLPTSVSDMNSITRPLTGTAWKEDPKTWLIGRLQRRP